MYKFKYKSQLITFIAGALIATVGTAHADEIEQFVLTKISYPILVKGKEYKDDALPALNY